MPVTVVINTHTKSTRALSHLMKSMCSSRGFDDANVIICEGGHYTMDTDYATSTPDHANENIVHVKCNHNSIDFTGLIALVEAFPNAGQCYFYMHDTCEVGPGFFEALERTIQTHRVSDSIAIGSPSMNMGFYSAGILFAHKNLIVAQKNRDPGAVQRWKARGVKSEDLVFRADPTCVIVPGLSSCSHRPVDQYGNGVRRITEHYAFLDLWKFKANFQGFRDEYELEN